MSDPAAPAPAAPSAFADAMASMDAGGGSDAAETSERTPMSVDDPSLTEGFSAESPARRASRGPARHDDPREAPDNPSGDDDYSGDTREEDVGELDDGEDEGFGEDEAEQDEQRGKGPTTEQLLEMHRAISSPTLPEQLFDRMIRVSDGEREFDVPIHEMRQGYMRAKNFSRSKGELASTMKQARALTENVRNEFVKWKQSPVAMMEGLREIVGDEAFDEMVSIRAVQRMQLKSMTPEQRQMFAEVEKAKAEARQAQLEARRLQEASRPDPQQQLAAIGSFVQQAVPQVLQWQGIAVNEASVMAFTRNFQPLWDGREETVRHAMAEAAIATAQEIKDNAREYYEQMQAAQQQQQNPRGRQRQLPPRAMPGPAPTQAQRTTRGTRKTGGRPSDFSRMIDKHGYR